MFFGLSKDELKHHVGPWTQKYKCHCGYLEAYCPSVCPNCGCIWPLLDDCVLITGREEWDVLYGYSVLYGHWHKILNEAFVEKPEGCQKGEK